MFSRIVRARISSVQQVLCLDMPPSISVGQILRLTINEQKLIERCFGPMICLDLQDPPTKIELTHLELSHVAYWANSVIRPCVVLDVEPENPVHFIGEPPNITIVLLTDFDGVSIDEAIPDGDKCRLVPVAPTESFTGMIPPLRTTEEWAPVSESSKPVYVLCVPVKIYSSFLENIATDVWLEPESLADLKKHLSTLPKLSVTKYPSDDDNSTWDHHFFLEDRSQPMDWDLDDW